MSEVIEACVPDLGSDSGVPVIELLVKVGETVKKDQGLLTLESDKATMEVPSPVAGEIVEIIAKLGDELSAGDLVARIRVSVAASTSAPVPAVAPAAAPVPAKAPEAPMPAPAAVAAAAPAPAAKSAVHSPDNGELVPGKVPYASPAVRVFARELGVDLSQVKGSERGGRISKEDVQQFVKATLAGGMPSASSGNGLNLVPWPQVDFSKFGPIHSEPLSRIKKLSGANLARNWAMIPHVTQFDEADITEMELFRKKLGEEHKDVKVTPLVFLIKAAVAALKKFPRQGPREETDRRRHAGGLLHHFLARRHRRHGFHADHQCAGSGHPRDFQGADQTGLDRRGIRTETDAAAVAVLRPSRHRRCRRRPFHRLHGPGPRRSAPPAGLTPWPPLN